MTPTHYGTTHNGTFIGSFHEVLYNCHVTGLLQ